MQRDIQAHKKNQGQNTTFSNGFGQPFLIDRLAKCWTIQSRRIRNIFQASSNAARLRYNLL